MMLDQPWTLRRLSLLVVLVVSFGPDAILTTATEVSAADAAAKALTAGTEKSTAPAVQDPELFRQVIRTTEALSPEEERQSFIVPPGFEVQLVAADPDIAKPLNMAFDTRGRLWITDSLEYPTPVPLDQKGRDSVKVLEDTNGDGHADRITTFADGLNIPMGLYPYKDGVVCFSIPDILFLRDTDSDGKADVRQKLYGPMGWERDTHGMCNAFTRGFDGWLYSCHGFNNHTTVSGSDGHEITMQSGNTFRMRLDGSRVEHFTHGQVNPFGMTLDPTGDLFNADCHTKPITLLLKDGCYESFGKPHDGLGFVPNVMDHLHGSTAIGGIAQYNATGFPEEYRGNTFGGNVMTSRVNRNALVLTGSSVRAEAKPDFLISSDPWFRPSDLQIGPDGALYIADFYNRIIGHYEVGLDHPGRDRRRGRIWRVIYRGDNPDSASKMDDLTQLSLKELVERLESPHLTVRSLATDRLVDDIGNACSETVRAVFLDAKRSPAARSHALWILHRLSELTLSELAQAVHPSSPTLLKTHGHRVLGELEPVPAEVLPWIVQGFSDDDGRVRRAAVSASTAHPTVATLQPLIALHSGTPDADPHLRHSIKMALRNHLEQPQMLQQLEEQPLTQLQRKLIADVCLAVKTPAAGEFLVRHIADIENADRSRLAEIMRTAAGRVSKESVERIAELAQSRFADDSEFQIELLAGIRSALPPSEKLPPAISAWLAKLIRNLLDRGPPDAGGNRPRPLAWAFSPHPGKSDRGNPWVIQSRKSSDSVEAPFFCSLPRGEAWTGIYRSEPLAVGNSFSFFTAGHIGVPGQPVHAENFIRLRDAQTHDVLHEATPPRNDIAQQTTWNTQEIAGRSVYVELVDGHTGSGYAWLAVGRFSADLLNPSEYPNAVRKAAELIADYQLSDYRPDLVALLREFMSDAETSSRIAHAIVALRPDARLAAVAEALSISASGKEQRIQGAAAIIAQEPDDLSRFLEQTFRLATSAQQLRLTEELAADRSGATLLLALATSGKVAPRLLTQPTVEPKLKALNDESINGQLASLLAELPDENVEQQKLIDARQKAFFNETASVEIGVSLFRKNCAVCHQVAGQGKQIGPNLDGIGNRGLSRLIEDLLAPNRNVDVAFRATTIVTLQGKVLTGLVRRIDGDRLILVDGKGAEVAVPVDSIDEKVPSKLSPMPANFVESLSEPDFRHLVTYLLSLR